MSWIVQDKRTRIQKWCTNILKAGHIPKHIGIIMDGNRRYSKVNAISTFDAYNQGFDKFMECLRWCSEFGVKEVTNYAFSIENFKRSEEEKEYLFEMMKRKLETMLEDDEIMEDYEKAGVCIRIVGDWTLIPADLKSVMAEVMVKTRKNTNYIINIAFAYTARNEIARGAETLRQAVLTGDLEIDDISEELLSETLQILPSNPVDMIIRTSGVTRLSDFLLWQSSESVLCFTKRTWPELTFWDFWNCIFEYQTNFRKINKVFPRKVNNSGDIEANERKGKYIQSMRKATWKTLAIEADLDLDDE